MLQCLFSLSFFLGVLTRKVVDLVSEFRDEVLLGICVRYIDSSLSECIAGGSTPNRFTMRNFIARFRYEVMYFPSEMTRHQDEDFRLLVKKMFPDSGNPFGASSAWQKKTRVPAESTAWKSFQRAPRSHKNEARSLLILIRLYSHRWNENTHIG